ncbi:A disintegrin and metalloproteinase with thrombospondin motifs 3-like isoform X4 [Diorhabda sublineata]|uniref:A disintegrin and metalloproteinase with thrombospondin motifs 3-like isoform X4 n=1 Tax=Diorhabda sublineata TaxID=1163346 RepID=UPI0024E118F4|nr:A disintegrin and metalloproteinase with thrombospondin motifs 3-like isoform X4 [Diorhabda sublineata]
MERIRFMCFHLYNQNMFFCVFVASLIVCAFEFCGADLDLTYAEDVHSVFPRMEVKRIKRSLGDGDVKVVKLGDWSLELESQGNLVLAPGLKTEWYKFNNVPILEEPKKCNYHMGVVKGMKGSSKAAVSICNTLFRGYFEVGNVVNFFEPLDEKTGEHVIYKSKTHIHKRSPTTNRWIFNLTGDTIDIDDNLEEYEEEENQQDIETTSENFFEIDNMTIVDVDDSDDGNFSAFPFTHPEGAWHQLGDDGEEDDGYFYDNEWTPSLIQVRKSPSGSILSPRWMEIAVAVDHTLISFHGREMVEEYVLSLLNIVSAIYQDPSLESNMKLVVTKLLMYEHKKYRHRVIKSGNAKKSLENVNSWNKALHASLRPGEPVHDVAIWLTRSDIGGPSGYAPVGGVCDPKRSCALNRDEGLTSAFIIAHETAHILGLSHDGDEKNDNDCSDDILDGSIMAPMVSATFNKFYWSECSRREFKKARSKWLCLLNSPIESLGEIPLNATLQASFTMDQQCRMEFGEGYKMCTAFEIIEPCSHLWCGHEKTPLVCKTKKGPPLEGTECGFGKWCVNGYCEDFAKRVERIPIVLNPQDGQWGDWGPWGPCTKSCDTGVQFRARKCDNPPPSFGGKVCEGDSEEWRLCKITECGSQIYVDLRAQQCKHLPKIFNLVADNITWLPYESDENAKKCKFICLNADKREIYFTDENLVDGSLCSYENNDNICVQIVVDKSDLRLGINISYSTEYSIHKDYLLPSSRFVWILGGWGPCSVSCEGGRRQRTAACFDNNNNKIVKRTHCSLFQKPKLDIESCNTFSCSFKWVPGEWEPCTTSCGTLGVQHREIYCLPGSVLESTNSTIKNPWRFMVNPIRCDGDTKPSSLKFCNRKPCLSFWTFGNWTQCSSTCGSGFKTRSSYCFPPPDETFFTCGDSPPPQRQRCLGTNDRFSKQSCKKKNKFTCQQDESEFCKFDLLHKYCQIKGFRRICCKACSNNSTMSI